MKTNTSRQKDGPAASFQHQANLLFFMALGIFALFQNTSTTSVVKEVETVFVPLSLYNNDNDSNNNNTNTTTSRIRQEKITELEKGTGDDAPISNSGVPPLSQLTRSHIQSNIECPEPLVPFYDRIVDPSPNATHQKIPRQIHLAWIRGFSTNQSRCISQDMMEVPNRWMEKFPSYNIYFHDDDAVDALFAQDWPEFPQLSKFMKACVQYGGAMRIDIWRILVLYRYGGFYSDFDMAPGPKLSESVVDSNDTAFFLSDEWGRPSQWLFGLEAQHPIANCTMHEIFKRLMALEDVATVKLVFLTGPDALKFGYWWGLDHDHETYKGAFANGYHMGKYGKRVRKLPQKRYVQRSTFDMVPYPRDNHNSTTTETEPATMITVKERIEKEMNTIHWLELIQKKDGLPRASCMELLNKLESETS